jgi:uncharacterized protein (TIGR02246 family)
VSEHLLEDADHAELARLVTEISWRIDHGKADTVHELFVDDGEMILGETRLSGREEIRAWGRGLLDAAWRIRHVTTNMRFVADGDDAAVGTTLVTAYMDERGGPGTTQPWAVGEDHDRFVRTDQGWRLVSRTWDELFLRENP